MAQGASLKRSRSSRLARRVIAASATTAALAPAAPLSAQDVSFGGGVFVGYNVGPRAGVEWGFEAFATRLLRGSEECSNTERAGVGPLLQLGLLGVEQPRLTLAAQGGGEFARSVMALSGELGATYRFGSQAGFGIHMGIVPETLFLNAAARYQWLLNDAWFGGGVRIQPTYGSVGMCAVGRPLRTEVGFAQVGAAIPVDVECAPLVAGQENLELVGRAYERDAQLECASVPAFLQLSAELALQRAPAGLIARAVAAARDEVRHAQDCVELASRHLRQRLRPSAPEVSPRKPLAGASGLVQLAVESWIDGCLAEGLAAAQAERAATVSTDADAGRLQRGVAVDEQRHAELAWAILDWALVRGGDEVREALRVLRDVEAAAPPEPAPEGLERHGRLGQRALVELDRAHRAASRERLDRVLA